MRRTERGVGSGMELCCKVIQVGMGMEIRMRWKGFRNGEVVRLSE